ncbi:hypothetical protein BH11PLA2_BH11PLA2_44380 [soil metagenome]
MRAQPLVSVAMIAYNHRPFIAQALASVLAQRCDFAFEIVISDDRSPDGTASVIDDFQRQHPDIIRRLDPPKNVGMHVNFNRVWQACTGKYIAILEGDDFWNEPTKLQQQAAFLEAHPEVTVSGHSVWWCDEQGTVNGRFPEEAAAIPIVCDGSRLFHQGNYLQTCGVMVRRGVVPVVPEWIAKLGYVDYPLLLLHGFRGSVGFEDRPDATYRRHVNSIWTPKTALFKQLQHYRMLCEMSRLSDSVVGTFAADIRQHRDESAAGLFDEAHWHRKQGNCDQAWRIYRELLREKVTRRVLLAAMKNAVVWANPFRVRQGAA